MTKIVVLDGLCAFCTEPFTMDRHQRHRLKAGKASKVYCSVSCSHQDRKGKANPNWRGGKTIDKDGYILVHCPNHPYANHVGYVREHRLVMEEMLGRFLTPNEVVHHKDENPENNEPSNLELMPNESVHRKLHVPSQPRNHEGKFKRSAS